jgi:hypothetical protein
LHLSTNFLLFFPPFIHNPRLLFNYTRDSGFVKLFVREWRDFGFTDDEKVFYRKGAKGAEEDAEKKERKIFFLRGEGRCRFLRGSFGVDPDSVFLCAFAVKFPLHPALIPALCPRKPSSTYISFPSSKYTPTANTAPAMIPTTISGMECPTISGISTSGSLPRSWYSFLINLEWVCTVPLSRNAS